MTALIAICALVTCAGLLVHSFLLYQTGKRLLELGCELRQMLSEIEKSGASDSGARHRRVPTAGPEFPDYVGWDGQEHAEY